MRKLVLVLAIFAACTALSAVELDILGTALYTNDIAEFDASSLGENLSFGGELRFKLGILRADANLIALTGKDEGQTYFIVPTDLGLSLDILFLRAGLGVGPVFFLDQGESGMAGINLKASADLLLGKLDLGLEAYLLSGEPAELIDPEVLMDPNNWTFGATLGFRLK